MRKDLKLAFLGPQGSGKGTQATLLARSYDYKILGMGAILREVAEEDTARGRQVNALIDKGQLVPNEITFEILKEYIDRLDPEQGLLFDGFPRNIGQAKFLDQMLVLDAVVEIAIDKQTALERLLFRLSCPAGHIYNLKTHPPKRVGICDVDGKPLEKRDDDIESAVKKRLEIYFSDTAQVIEHYQALDRLIRIDGLGSIKEVSRQLEDKLSKL